MLFGQCKNIIEKILNQVEKWWALLIIIIFLLFSGYLIGAGTGSMLLKSILFNKKSSPFLIYKPAQEFFAIYRYINSNNELERLNGYYALMENRIIDEEYLCERLNIEESTIIKRTIVWILGSSSSADDILDCFNEIYSNSNDNIKREILRSLKRIDEKAFNEFINKNKISIEILKGV